MKQFDAVRQFSGAFFLRMMGNMYVFMSVLFAVCVVQEASGAQNSPIRVRKDGSNDQPVFYVSSIYPGPVEVEFQMTKAVNVLSDPPLPARFIIPDGQEVKTFALRAAHPGAVLSYAYKFVFTPGVPGAQHRPPGPYLPPFQKGLRFRIGNGFSPESFQNNPYNAYSVSILMPPGTQVCAARSGILTEIGEQSFRRQTAEGITEEKSVLIRILHDDGTMSVYTHLQPGSIPFSPGTRISQGQVIAVLGNFTLSGASSLIFIIQKNEGMRLVSVPFEFAECGGKKVIPVRGMVLTAGH
ncbi:MAG: M23 family metallopeptidase [Desulfococcaceae bacterium]